MGKLTALIRSHQAAAFYMLTFAITWGLGFSYPAFTQANTCCSRWQQSRLHYRFLCD